MVDACTSLYIFNGNLIKEIYQMGNLFSRLLTSLNFSERAFEA